MTATVPPGVNAQQMPTSECRILGRVTLVHTAFGTWVDERVTLGSTAREVKNYKFCPIYFHSGLNNFTNTPCLTNTKGAIAIRDLLPVAAAAGVVGRPTSIDRTNERTKNLLQAAKPIRHNTSTAHKSKTKRRTHTDRDRRAKLDKLQYEIHYSNKLRIACTV